MSRRTLRDLPATIASLVGHDRDSPFPGRSLDRFWTESNSVGSSQVGQVLMETDKPPFLANQGREPGSKGPMKSLISEGLHYIRRGDGVEETYHLDADPLGANGRGVISCAISMCSSDSGRASMRSLESHDGEMVEIAPADRRLERTGIKV